jgi:LmbE family N-acetylglucosaminyl deacetylase
MDACPTIPHVGTLLGVWAHPDDEAYLSAGLMALARRHGQRVVVVTATAGEAGGTSADVRRREMAAALAAVGVDEHHELGFADGLCEHVAASEGTALIRRIIEDVRPDTIVTFGPDGMTGHPDHRAVSAWTTSAWQALGGGESRPPRLWYATKTVEFHTQWYAVNDRIGLWGYGGQPPCTPASWLAQAIECTGELGATKARALDAHESQTAPLAALIGRDTWTRWWATEAFVDAAA